MMTHPAFTLPAQLLAARGHLLAEERERKEQRAQYASSRALTGTVAGAVLRVLGEAAEPMLATEIKALLPVSARFENLGPTLLKLMLRGLVERQGREGKYRYTLN